MNRIVKEPFPRRTLTPGLGTASGRFVFSRGIEDPGSHTGNFLRLSIDRQSYTPGDLISGTVQAHVERPVKIRSLEVHLEGRERVVIDAPKARFTSTNEMLNVGLRLLENTTLNPGDTTLPFQFQLPPNALPSHIGSYASVNWKLSARADIPWHFGLSDEGFLRILIVRQETPEPVLIENPEAQPKVRLELSSNIFEPGETIMGKLTVLEPGSLRSIRLQIMQHEDATARGTLANAHRSQDRPAGPMVGIRTDSLAPGSSTTFQLPLPTTAPCSYRGAYSWAAWALRVVLDVPHAEDVAITIPFLVGLKTKPVAVVKPEETPAATATQVLTTVQEASGSTILEQAPPPAAPEPTAPGDRRTIEAREAIIGILSDGSSRDLITVSTELQEKTGDYLDLDQVRRLCEDLVARDRLTRTAEGEFFAKYSIKTPFH